MLGDYSSNSANVSYLKAIPFQVRHSTAYTFFPSLMQYDHSLFRVKLNPHCDFSKFAMGAASHTLKSPSRGNEQKLLSPHSLRELSTLHWLMAGLSPSGLCLLVNWV